MTPARLLVTGAAGQLGGHVLRAVRRDWPAAEIVTLLRPGAGGSPTSNGVLADLCELDALAAAVERARPTHILHLAAMTSVADAHADPAAAQRVNTDATLALADAAARRGARFLFCSTDMVFAGDNAPYGEASPTRPLSRYGRTKADAERGLLERAGGDCLIVRVPLLFGSPAGPRRTTFVQQIDALRRGEPLRLFADEFRTPIWLPDAAGALAGLANGTLRGVVHVPGPRRVSRYELIARAAAALGVSEAGLVSISRNDIPAAEPRPADLSLRSDRLWAALPEFRLHSLDEAMRLDLASMA